MSETFVRRPGNQLCLATEFCESGLRGTYRTVFTFPFRREACGTDPSMGRPERFARVSSTLAALTSA